MKKTIKFLVLLSAVGLFAISNSKAQEIVVRERLHRSGVVFVRPVRPSPRHVWVAEEWVPGGATYVHHEGYWAVPAHPGAIWITGHWRHRRGGYVWIPGHWSI